LERVRVSLSVRKIHVLQTLALHLQSDYSIQTIRMQIRTPERIGRPWPNG
jgi:hypothetical protein